MLNRILDDSRKTLLSELHRQLGELRVALVRAEATEEHQKALGRAISQLDELLLLVVVGEFNAGKSAVINVLLGQRVLEEGVTPTTSRIQLLKHGPVRRHSPAGGDYEEITLPVALLREMSVVDTPGTNAVVRGHEALTREFVPRADLVLFVTSADRPFTETERIFLESIRDWGKKLVVAVNKTDILEKPEDVRKVVEFVQDKLRELLGLKPEVFGVSARQAWKARTTGGETEALATGFGALEAYLIRTLDDAERVRIKLQSPVGVAERVIEGTTDASKARLAAVAEDEAALKEIDTHLVQHLQELTRDLRLRLSEAERPLVELEKRGQEFLEGRLRIGGLLALLDRERTAAGFRQEVIGGLQAGVDKRVDGVADALVAGETRVWTAVVERVNRRRALHGPRVPGALEAPPSDRTRLGQALGRDVQRALESYSPREEAARVASAARRAAWWTLLLPGAAIVVAAVAVARAETATGALLGVLVTAAIALAGVVRLPLLLRGEKGRLGKAVTTLRERLSAALRGSYERELDTSQKRVQEGVAPFSRFVRSEAERLRGQSHELASRRKELEALRVRIAGLR